MSFIETQAERCFREALPVCHLYTKPIEDDVFFKEEQERAVAMNFLAIAVKRNDCRLLAFSIMSNHFHFVLEGRQASISAFFNDFKQHLDRYFKARGRGHLAANLEAGQTHIDNVKQFRTTLSYVIRNAFVVRPDVHVFADPWSSGHLYFNPFLRKEGIPIGSLSVRQLRKFTSSRLMSDLPADIYVKDGMAQAWSFVDYERAMSFYENARQFVFSVVRNVEAQVETAISCGERPQFADEDLIPVVYSLCRDQFKSEGPAVLDKANKQQLAILLKNKYYCSNGQIARVAKMTLSEVNAVFPLTAKAQIR